MAKVLLGRMANNKWQKGMRLLFYGLAWLAHKPERIVGGTHDFGFSQATDSVK
jgi:hypothetical protein